MEPDAKLCDFVRGGAYPGKGEDLNIVTRGGTSYLALGMTRQSEIEDRSIKVVDLRTLAPFDEEMIYRTARKRNRLSVSHEDSLSLASAERLPPASRKASWIRWTHRLFVWLRRMRLFPQLPVRVAGAALCRRPPGCD